MNEIRGLLALKGLVVCHNVSIATRKRQMIIFLASSEEYHTKLVRVPFKF